ncbi:MAG TPA: hypothetical protein VKB51_11440 [bacterium]|nr:hypothetical protein [bacterium]
MVDRSGTHAKSRHFFPSTVAENGTKLLGDPAWVTRANPLLARQIARVWSHPFARSPLSVTNHNGRAFPTKKCGVACKFAYSLFSRLNLIEEYYSEKHNSFIL